MSYESRQKSRLQSDERQVLYLVKCALLDEVPKTEELLKLSENANSDRTGENGFPGEQKPDYIRLKKVASSMMLEPFYMYALKLGDGQTAPREWYERQLYQLRTKAVGRMAAAGETARLQKTLSEMGIESALIKGQAEATAYRHPELRRSIDIDLYVDESQEAAVYDWAEKNGWKVSRRVAGTRNGTIIHPLLGLIELHGALLRDDEALVESMKDEESVLQNPREAFTEVDFHGYALKTIGMTDHMKFIFMHMIFHYLRGDVEMRMLVDINMFFAAYRDRMDLKELQNFLKRMRYDRMFRAVLLIGNKYLGFQHDLTFAGENANRNYVGNTDAGSEKSMKTNPGENIRTAMEEKPEDELEECAEELICDICHNVLSHEANTMVYDEYSMRSAPSGLKRFLYKCKILAANIPAAITYQRKHSAKQVLATGKKRVKNLFLPTAKDETASQKAQARLRVLENMRVINGDKNGQYRRVEKL